jgi:hypothetical protein
MKKTVCILLFVLAFLCTNLFSQGKNKRYKNRLYVSEWNYRYTTIKNHGEYDSFIDYDPETDYGLDLNYKLYYYFKYFEEKHGTKLYPSFR